MAITTPAETKGDLLSFLDSPEFKSAALNATRLAEKLVTAVSKDEVYNTHQLLRTIYYRFVNHRDKLKPLVDLLYHGSKFLLAHQEPVSGHDVATLCLESSAKLLQSRLDYPDSSSNSSIDLEICNKIAHLVYELPDTEFLAEALKQLNPKILNRKLFHRILAKTYYSHDQYAEARYHFLYCADVENASEIGELLATYHEKFGNKNEVDLFLAQFILQFLCIQDENKDLRPHIRSTIEFIIRQYRATLRLSNEPTPNPMINFLRLMTSLLDRGTPEPQTFKALCEIYKTILERDPNYQSYLDRIGVLYFGMIDQQQQQQQQGGFFNNILMSLLE